MRVPPGCQKVVERVDTHGLDAGFRGRRGTGRANRGVGGGWRLGCGRRRSRRADGHREPCLKQAPSLYGLDAYSPDPVDTGGPVHRLLLQIRHVRRPAGPDQHLQDRLRRARCFVDGLVFVPDLDARQPVRHDGHLQDVRPRKFAQDLLEGLHGRPSQATRSARLPAVDPAKGPTAHSFLGFGSHSACAWAPFA